MLHYCQGLNFMLVSVWPVRQIASLRTSAFMRATCASIAHRCALLAKSLPMVLDCLDVNSLLPGRGKLGGYTSSYLRFLLNFLLWLGVFPVCFSEAPVVTVSSLFSQSHVGEWFFKLLSEFFRNSTTWRQKPSNKHSKTIKATVFIAEVRSLMVMSK